VKFFAFLFSGFITKQYEYTFKVRHTACDPDQLRQEGYIFAWFVVVFIGLITQVFPKIFK